MFPTFKATLTDVFTNLGGMFSGVVGSIGLSTLWQKYGNWISFAVGGAIIGLFVHYGHAIFGKVRRAAVRSAATELQGAPVPVAPQMIPQNVPTQPPTPIIAPTPVLPTPPPPQEKKEGE